MWLLPEINTKRDVQLAFGKRSRALTYAYLMGAHMCGMVSEPHAYNKYLS